MYRQMWSKPEYKTCNPDVPFMPTLLSVHTLGIIPLVWPLSLSLFSCLNPTDFGNLSAFPNMLSTDVPAIFIFSNDVEAIFGKYLKKIKK